MRKRNNGWDICPMAANGVGTGKDRKIWQLTI